MAPTHAAKIKKACTAMKEYDRPEAKVKSYDNKWDFIEDEGYKVLLDAIFDEADVEVTENKKKEEENKSNDVATTRGKKKALEQTQLVVKDEDDDIDEEETQRRLRRKRDNNPSLSLASPISKKAREEEPKPEAEDEDDDMNVLPPLKRYLRRRVERGSAITEYNKTSQPPPVIFLPAGPLQTGNDSDAGALVIFNDEPFTEHKPIIPDRVNCSAPMLEMEKSNMPVEEENGEPEGTLNDTISWMFLLQLLRNLASTKSWNS